MQEVFGKKFQKITKITENFIVDMGARRGSREEG
jgi:hypothetical protein